MFAFYMVNELEEKHGLKSQLTLGFYDPKKFTGLMHWHPVEMKYMYGVKLDGIKVNGKLLDLGCDKKKCLATVDSGTSHLAVPTWAYKKLAGKVPIRTQGVPCSASEEFGQLTYIINGQEYPIPNHEWTFEPEKARQVYKEKNPHLVAA